VERAVEVLRVENLSVEVCGRVIVRGVDLTVSEGDVLYIVGPNGSGKTTLLRGLAGYPGYREVSGRVVFRGEDVTGTTADYRVSKGLVLAHQIPPKLSGVRTRDLLNYIARRSGRVGDIEEVVRLLDIGHLVDREFGRGFSGGELKRVELATLLLLNPGLALIDEPDSGVDVDSVMLISEGIRRLYELSPHKAVVVVSHTALVSKYVRPTRVCVMSSGRVQRCGGPELLDEVMRYGFKRLA
jgi:Fe-S cluster assembly ATP-binding protein